MIINIHSDHILRNLRKPGERTYQIPQGTTANTAWPFRLWLLCPPRYSPSLCHSGGMFYFVSGANFFGEIVEWCGFALAAWSLPAFAFAFFTACSIGPRAYHHHRWLHSPASYCRVKESLIWFVFVIIDRDYKKRFEDYPSSRKAVIPFILWELKLNHPLVSSCQSFCTFKKSHLIVMF